MKNLIVISKKTIYSILFRIGMVERSEKIKVWEVQEVWEVKQEVCGVQEVAEVQESKYFIVKSNNFCNGSILRD